MIEVFHSYMHVALIVKIKNHILKCGGGGLVTKSCQTLCDPLDCSLPGPSVHGISQARILEWMAISFSNF